MRDPAPCWRTGSKACQEFKGKAWTTPQLMLLLSPGADRNCKRRRFNSENVSAHQDAMDGSAKDAEIPYEAALADVFDIELY